MTVNVGSEGADDLQFPFLNSLPHAKFSIGVEEYYIVRDLAVHAPCVRETKCSTTHWFKNQWWRQPHTPFFVKQHARFSSKGARLWPHHQGVKQITIKRYGSVNASCSVISQTISTCRLAAHQFHSGGAQRQALQYPFKGWREVQTRGPP